MNIFKIYDLITLLIDHPVHTGVRLAFIVWTKVDTNIKKTSGLETFGSMIMILLKPYSNQDHNLFVDNWSFWNIIQKINESL